MGSLASIVNVQISRQTSVPTRAGFGTGSFLANDTGLANATKAYTSLADMTGDSELTASVALDAGAAYFGQQLAAPKFTILRQGTVDQEQTSTLVFDNDLITDNVITVTIDGIEIAASPFTFLTSNSVTLAAIATGLQGEALIFNSGSNGTDTLTEDFVGFESHTINAVVAAGASQAGVTSTVTVAATAVQTITEALTAAASQNNDWYGLAIYSRVLADIEEASDWVQGIGSTNPKLFFSQSADANLLNGASSADIASILTAKSAFRTAVMYHSDDTEYADCAWMGGQLPNDPGSITWAYKSLSLVTVDTFAAGEKSAAHAKNCNTYDVVASVNITEEGKTCDGGSGEFIDTIRGVDWIQVNAQADLYTILVQSPKVPYTTTGLAMFKLTLISTLRRAVLMGILTTDEDPVVTVPLIGDIPVVDKATRTLNNLNFTAILAGAIQKVNVQGVVSL